MYLLVKYLKIYNIKKVLFYLGCYETRLLIRILKNAFNIIMCSQKTKLLYLHNCFFNEMVHSYKIYKNKFTNHY